MSSTLNSALLSSMIKTRRGEKNLRDTASEIGHISAATLSRIEQGKLPDVETFILLCKWLNVSPDTFVTGKKKSPAEVSEKEMLLYQLRSSNQLDKSTIDTMVRMVDMAYTKVRRSGKK